MVSPESYLLVLPKMVFDTCGTHLTWSDQTTVYHVIFGVI